MTHITEYDRSKFKGFKFSYQLNGSAGKFLSIQETPDQAIEEYFDFFGINPTECKQLSKYPTIE
jgi:hypothetical protein